MHVALARRAVVAAIFACLVLAGCSSADEGDHKGSGNVPSCDDLWVAGATLPVGYDGCRQADGVVTVAAMYDCDDGSIFTTYDRRFFGTLGGEVAAGPNAADGSDNANLAAAYAGALGTCTSNPDRSVHRIDPGKALRAAVEDAGSPWTDDITSYFNYSNNTVVVFVTSDLSTTDAASMCADLVAFAGNGDVPSDLSVFVENPDGTDLAKC